MDLKQIEKLMAAMGRNEMKRMVLKKEGFELELEREGATYVATSPVVTHQHTAPPPPQEAPSKPTVKEGHYITSPMVGTFYTSPSPNDPAYVKLGDKVDGETLVCIIEAMKVMNEVKAGLDGEIVEILVKNGDPVEFGTQIFRVT